MPTFLLPDDPVTSLDAYLATDIGGLGIERAQRIGPAATIDAVARLRAARPGRRRVPDRPEVGRHRGAGRDPPLRGVQRRRGRAGHVQGPRPAAGQPVPARRRRHHRRVRRRRRRGVHLPQAQLRARDRRRSPGPCRSSRRPASAPTAQVTIVAGPDEYLFGEEKAMLEVIEGKPPLPRWFPPYEHGLFATAPQLGWEATPRSGLGRWPEPDARQQRRDAGQRAPHPRPRARLVPLDGHRRVARHDRRHRRRRRRRPRRRRGRARHAAAATVIDAVGSGIAPGRVGQGRVLRRRQPGRHRRPASTCRSATRASQAIGSGMGAAGFIVYDDTTCMVDAAYRLSRFLSIESCGQCPPCKLGSGEITNHLERLETGAGSDDDLRWIRHWLDAGHRRQPLLPRRRGATRGRQHPASVPRRVRRAHRARPVPPPTAPPDPQAASTSPTARPPTTRRSGGSAPTGPTNPTSEVLSEPAARRARAGCRPDRDRTIDPCSFPDADGTNVPPVTHRANFVAAPAMASARPPGSKASSSSRSVRSTRGASGRATRSSTTPVTAAQPTRPRV